MAIETNELIDVQTLTPFKKFIMTIGNIPTSYLESMTYAELLMWFCNYLQETVIPTVNNNAEAVEELQNFVTEYFDNLDVTEEIENKLDEMASSGQLQNLLSLQYNELRTEVNDDINDIRDIVTSVASGSPLVASDTSEMTDTTRVYVNTTDGKWYYYDGDSWEIGGDYQSSGIANGSIDILMLNDKLQENFFAEYSDPLTLSDLYAGFYKADGTLSTSSTNYSNQQLALENGKIYAITNRDFTNTLCGILIMDSSDNVIYASNTAGTTKNVSIIFRCNENNLTLYLSFDNRNNATATNFRKFMFARELSNVYNQLRYSNEIPEILNHQGFLQAGTLGDETPSIVFNDADTNGTYYFYQMSKGRTYQIDGYNYSNVCGCAIFDLNRELLYASSTENIGSNWVDFTKTYTATTDGFIILTTYQSHDFNIQVINDNINVINNSNNIYGKKLTVNGDSICAGAGYTGGYAKIIGNKYNMTIQNVAHGGATITSNTYSDLTPRHWINETIDDMNDTYDYAIVEGGVNDASLGVTLGSLSSGYDAVLDTDTYYGAFENMLKELTSRFKGKKYGYIAVHQMTNNYRASNDPATSYYWAAKKCCEKWGVPFLDLNTNVPPFAYLRNTSLSSLPETYTKDGDGWHPNELGYKKYYVDKIVAWLESL